MLWRLYKNNAAHYAVLRSHKLLLCWKTTPARIDCIRCRPIITCFSWKTIPARIDSTIAGVPPSSLSSMSFKYKWVSRVTWGQKNQLGQSSTTLSDFKWPVAEPGIQKVRWWTWNNFNDHREQNDHVITYKQNCSSSTPAGDWVLKHVLLSNK